MTGKLSLAMLAAENLNDLNGYLQEGIEKEYSALDGRPSWTKEFPAGKQVRIVKS